MQNIAEQGQGQRSRSNADAYRTRKSGLVLRCIDLAVVIGTLLT